MSARPGCSPITRKRVVLGLGVLFNFLLPWAVYRLSVPHLGETHAIVATAVAPGVWSLIQFARSREVYAMSVLVLSGIALSLVVLALGGSPKILLFRESLITGLGSLVLIGSAVSPAADVCVIRYAFTSGDRRWMPCFRAVWPHARARS